MRARWALLVALGSVLLASCKSIPEGQYGVSRLRFRGVRAFDEQALRVCLATEQRRRLELGLSALRTPECGEPPFDRARLGVSLFAWPWTPWPLYDEAVLRLDLQRIQRWYEARGHYGARVLDVVYDPSVAETSDEAFCGDRGCPLDLTIIIAEGSPVRIATVELTGAEALPPKLRARLDDALELKPGQRFDEAYYDRAKQRLLRVLREAGYARARVEGEVRLDRESERADVHFRVQPGNLAYLGMVSVESRVSVPDGPILAASMLRPGTLYDEDALDDAQRAVYALGAFSAVTVRGDLDQPGDRVDIVIEVEPRRESQWMLGGGILNGVLATGVTAPEWVSVPQWDLHLMGSYEHRNFRGGLRRLRIEERPRMLFLAPFPNVPGNSPRFGNFFAVDFSQPGVIEPRTHLRSRLVWDYGPDPFLLFFRHAFGVSVGLLRGFFKQRLVVEVAAHQEFMQVSARQPIATEVPSSYVLPFLEQRVILDLRNQVVSPSYGAYFAVSAHEAFHVSSRSWNYLRLTPEARGYVPLGLGVVLAGRFAIGWLEIFKAGSHLDAQSQALGPQDYRLRGGGAQSNRGFLPGQLGVGLIGGVRRWESSLELRVPISQNLSLALFGDMGDVNSQRRFRFGHLNTALGGGLRYRTLIGPIRFDVGVRPSGLQVVGGGRGSQATGRFFGHRFEGAVHLTIGEPF